MNDSGRKILHLLRKSDTGMSMEELCAALEVTPMAVHRPLNLLKENGLVSSEILRLRKRGRPVRIYKVTESGDEQFPKNYGALLLELLQHVRLSEGPRKIRLLFEACFKGSVQAHREIMKGKDLGARVRMLSEILNKKNYMADIEQTNRSKFVIKLQNCPISKVAREFPQACSCEQKYLSELLHADVRRDRHILNGENYCSYIIRRK